MAKKKKPVKGGKKGVGSGMARQMNEAYMPMGAGGKKMQAAMKKKGSGGY